MVESVGNGNKFNPKCVSKPTLVYEKNIAKKSTSNSGKDSPAIVRFERKELNQILRIYGFKVASGEWRDYAIDMLKDRAVFSVFRRTSEMPLFAIEKTPKLARRQGAYSVINGNGLIIKRGQELAQVLKIFDNKPRLAAV